MYNLLDYYRDIHIIAKVIALVLGVWGILLNQNPWLFFLFAGYFFYIYKNPRMFLLEFLLILISLYYGFFLGFVKIVLLGSMFWTFFRTINFSEFRYFIECCLYHSKHSKVQYWCLYVCHFVSTYLANWKELIVLFKAYGRKINLSMIRYVVLESFQKTKDQMEKLLVLYQYRFYHITNQRSYVEKNTITSIDLKYILIFAIILLIVQVYGR